MPGLIGSQGIRPGALNMNRIFRALRYRSEQAQYVTYHRLPIYETDAYGVPDGDEAAPELLLPDLPAIIRPAVTADYQQERAGNNIVGAARIYTPNINTIKNYPNFDQGNFTGTAQFNEIEGWDRLITNYRTIFSVPTTGTTNWTGTGSVASDGESLTLTATGDGNLLYQTTAKNTLEADRLRFKIRGSGSVELKAIRSYHGGTNSAYRVNWDNDNFVLLDNNWLTVDVPFVSGTSATSIYQTGTRYNVPVTTGISFDYENDLRIFRIEYNADNTDTLQIKDIEYYKSVSWHVHSLKDMTDGYIIFNCVRTAGRDDARRRAE